jgi:hypothetical protein
MYTHTVQDLLDVVKASDEEQEYVLERLLPHWMNS